MPGACCLWTDKRLIEVDRPAIFTGNNNISEIFKGVVLAWRPGRPSFVRASGDLESRIAYSKVYSIRPSILSTDGLEVVLGVMNKGVDFFARRG